VNGVAEVTAHRARAVATLLPVFTAFGLAFFGLQSVSSVRQVESLRPLAIEAAEESGLGDPNLLLALVNYESKGNPAAVSSAEAIGLTQLKPAAAKDAARFLGRPAPDIAELLDPSTNLLLGAAYLKLLIDRYGGATDVALVAYFKGPGWVASIGGLDGARRWLRTTNEVTLYVTRILDLAERLRVRASH
jgi:soluble lytic murein transglycosylase-like protein